MAISTTELYSLVHLNSKRPRWAYAVLLAMVEAADSSDIVRGRESLAVRAQELVGDRGYEARHEARANRLIEKRKDLGQAKRELEIAKQENNLFAVSQVTTQIRDTVDRMRSPAYGNVSRVVGDLMAAGLIVDRWYEDADGLRYEQTGRGRTAAYRLKAGLRP